MSFPRLNKNSTGFTLIELLIVIGVVGVLAAVLITVLNPLNQFKKARDAQRRNDLKQLQQALENYYTDHGSYPVTSGANSYYSSEPGDYLGGGLDGGQHAQSDPVSGYIPGLAPDYITKLPRDPQGGNTTTPQCVALGLPGLKRAYTYKSNGQEYLLMSRCGPEYLPSLNNPKDALYSPSFGYRPVSSWQVCTGTTACGLNTW